MSVWDDNETETEVESEKISKKDKNKSLFVDHKSFDTAQSKIEKLRPLKDRIVLKVKHVNGFAGCFISDKIRVLCLNEEAMKEIHRILNRYTSSVEIVNVGSNNVIDANTKAISKNLKVPSRNVMIRSKSHVMVELRRGKSL